MRTYATAQKVGTRTHQCDAVAACMAPGGVRAYAVLDGVGDSPQVREWTRSAARSVANAASRHGDAESGLRDVYTQYAGERERQDPVRARRLPGAAAVVVVSSPGGLTVAWCGDVRAYLLRRGVYLRLTEDHNMRRVLPRSATRPRSGSRNVITSYLGSSATDEEVRRKVGHPAIESTSVTTGPDADVPRLVVATDGAYEPHEDAGHDIHMDLAYEPLRRGAEEWVESAVALARGTADNASVLVADLI